MKTNKLASNTRLKIVLMCTVGTAVLISSNIVVAQQYKKITRFGTNQAVCAGGVQTVEELQSFFTENPVALDAILADANFSGNAEDLVDAINNGEISERVYPVGTRFEWSSAKVGGKFVSKPYREWAGSTSFEAFHLNLASDCKIYHIAIPKACCNVSLISEVVDESEECTPVEPLPTQDDVAENPIAAPEKTKLAGLTPYVGLFAGSETRPRYETAWDMDKVDSSGVIGVRAGLLKELTPKTSVFGQVSYYDRQGINGGNVYPENNFAIDLGLERKLSDHIFIGGGLGVWNVDDSDFRDTSVFGHIGGDIGKSNFQWLVEGRLFDSDSVTNDSISDNRMFSVGVRYLIK